MTHETRTIHRTGSGEPVSGRHDAGPEACGGELPGGGAPPRAGLTRSQKSHVMRRWNDQRSVEDIAQALRLEVEAVRRYLDQKLAGPLRKPGPHRVNPGPRPSRKPDYNPTEKAPITLARVAWLERPEVVL